MTGGFFVVEKENTAMTIFATTGTRVFIGPPQSGDLTPVQYLALDTGSFATGTATFSANPADADTITFNGTVVTFKTTPAAALDILIGGTLEQTLDNLIKVLALSIDSQLVKFSFAIKEDVTDALTDTILLITAVTGGTGGNALTLAKTSTAITLSAATLTTGGGSAWTEILEIESVGDFGDSATNINFMSIQDGRVRKNKGSRDAGTQALICAMDARDPGQIALRKAEATQFKFAFKMIASDARLPSDTPSIFWYNAIVESQKTNFGTNNNIVKTTFNLGVDSAIFQLPSSPAGVTVYA